MESKYISPSIKAKHYRKTNNNSRIMVSKATEVSRQNIRKYKEKLEANNSKAIVGKDYCEGELLKFLGTNKELFPKQNQLLLL